MKVLLISALYPPGGRGGAEKAASLLAESLARSGDEVVVVSLHSGCEEIIEERNGVRVYRLPIANVYWPFDLKEKKNPFTRMLWHMRDIWNGDAAAKVGRILDLEKPDVVHTHVLAGFSVAVWKEVKKRNIRLVHTMHDYYLFCIRSSMFRKRRVCVNQCVGCRVATSVRKASSKRLDGVISVSNYVLNCHKRSGYFEQVPTSVIYNVMDSFEDLPGEKDNLITDTLIFGYIGKIEEEKGIRIVLEATKYLSMQNWRLRIAGTGLNAYIKTLKDQFLDPRIEWCGFVDSRTFYGSIHVSIIPSIWPDPLPYVVIETLSAGKSLICAESGGIPEIAALGAVVKTFPPADIPALAQVMNHALLNGPLWRTGGFSNK
ncbi:MAG: glycosyltransferase family 4 protein, partial [Nitrososphaerales archaeon]